MSRPLVVTSGNLVDEPIVIDDQTARDRLGAPSAATPGPGRRHDTTCRATEDGDAFTQLPDQLHDRGIDRRTATFGRNVWPQLAMLPARLATLRETRR